MNSSNKSNKWKDALLRSSLPLEHLIAQKLSKSGIYVSGEYTYLRPNENEINTEFSTDIWAFNFLEENCGEEEFLACCHFIIECKYCHPGKKWIFSPHLDDDDTLDVGYINIFQDLCVKQVNASLLKSFDQTLKYCIKGVEIDEKECNPEPISKGLNQLKYAAVQLSKNCITNQICAFHDEELRLEFLCPILVTTASLYVIKDNLTLNDFQGLNDVEDIAEKVNFLVVNQINGVQIDKYIEKIKSELCDTYKQIDTRLKEIDEILNNSDYQGYHMSNVFFLKEQLGRASTRILVVNYEHFEECINSIFDTIKNTNSTLKRYAILKYDYEERLSMIQPL